MTVKKWIYITEPDHFEVLADDRARTVGIVYDQKDADLIAAAPEMLETLKAVLNSPLTTNQIDKTMDIYRLIKKTIAKAEGTTK